ncbi:ABC transporter substrate-binding protein [Lachnoclostridium edouardi]|uniref:ABC transporter substrate-binding protein n=1 Tax=Lachnoclostridium edouardi TaxID=1926283 RepID=UPI000C7D1757|nr:ABC transporter substrate-binding protein [Lachnoclostridium edouardi]
MKKRVCMAAAVILAAGLALAGCGEGGASATEQGGEQTQAAGETVVPGETKGTEVDTTGFIRTCLVADIQTADVHKTSKDYEVPLNIYDRLVDVEVEGDGSTKIVGNLAESWDVSSDGLVYTFHLRQGVKYHNDADFTADDVKYSFERMLTVTGGTNSEFVDQILGATELFNGQAEELEGVKVLDDYTVEVTLREPYAGFLACLSSSGVAIYDRESTEEAGDQFGLDPSVTFGTGPFKFASWTLNDELVLVRNDNYWKGAPALPGIVIKIVPDVQTQTMMFENGELDIVDLDYARDSIDHFQATYPDQIVGGPRVGITYFTMNENIEPFADVKVRKAVQMAIDRQAILDSLYGGRGQLENGIFPQGLIGHNANIPAIEYNPEEAKELLEEAGYGDGFTMEIAADSSASDTVTMALQVIKDQLAQIGITAEIKTYDESTWLDTRNSGELGSFMSTWSADYNDPDNFIYTFFGNEEKTKMRSLNYPDTAVMERVQKARSIVNQDERIAEYNDLEEKLIIEDAAWVPILSEEHLFAVGKNVEGFTPAWNGLSDIIFYNVSLK